MQSIIKTFDDLTKRELYEILRLRVDVFVVEQACPYPEIDGKDYDAIHIYLENQGQILAYARVYEEEGQVHLGRVIAKERRKGHATLILKEAIKAAKEKYQTRKIIIEAQTYAKKLYEKVGFVEDSEVFLLDGIEHVKMVLQIK
ncbi:GNAT family N-acetyltransferase [Anaerococcus murdochii]|uniref:GNAT family N-acetyltransferase n=1 Tax=Anaerococcus murdochii TaxID=411577 RepID=A0ABS7SXP4_9FIRM|nr:GNAT family N-acetyltransferase [Anaerococcus murdochii]MBZ2386261.1 GNAT family N-acetyltransferase [Anaerococcus murdochii]